MAWPATHRSLDRIVLVAPAKRPRGGGPHILRRFVDLDEPVDLGLCGTETVAPSQAEQVRVGDNPGRLCQRCFNLYLHNYDEDRLPYRPSGQE